MLYYAPIMKKTFIIAVFSLLCTLFFAQSNNLKLKLFMVDLKSLTYEDFKGKFYNFNDYIDLPGEKEPGVSFDIVELDYLNKMQKYEFHKPENPIRRSEILFFGSLTFTVFGGWIFFSIFNAMIYNDPFGKLRNEQFLPLYFGSCIISFSVAISDLFINIKPKLSKNIEIY